MIPVEYDLGQSIVESCTCACGGPLSLVWDGESHSMRCAKDSTHDTVVEIKSLTQYWKEGGEVPYFIAAGLERKYRRNRMEESTVKTMVARADAGKLSLYVKAKFPKDLADPQAAKDFAQFCIAHALEPIRDCVPFHGTPYITVEWLDRQAAEDKDYQAYEYRLYTKDEKDSLQFDPKDLVIECKATWTGLASPLIGLGVVTILEREAKSQGGGFRSPIVAAHAQQMCFKRARSAALKQRYHIPAPILEELPYTTVIEAEYREIEDEAPPHSKEKPVAATKTADPAEAGQKPPIQLGSGRGGGSGAGEAGSGTAKGENTKKNRDAPGGTREAHTIRTFGDLYTACSADWPTLFPDRISVWKELGYSSQEDITELPSECYLKIQAARM